MFDLSYAPAPLIPGYPLTLNDFASTPSRAVLKPVQAVLGHLGWNSCWIMLSFTFSLKPPSPSLCQLVVTVGTNGPGSHSKCQKLMASSTAVWTHMEPETMGSSGSIRTRSLSRAPCCELQIDLGTPGPEPYGELQISGHAWTRAHARKNARIDAK